MSSYMKNIGLVIFLVLLGYDVAMLLRWLNP